MKFKRILSTGLSAVIAVSCISVAAAADTEDNSLGIAENEDAAASDGALTVTEAVFSFGSGNTALKTGTYNIDVSLKNAENKEEASLAADCISESRLTVFEDGEANISLELTAFTMSEAEEEAEAWAGSWLIYKGAEASGETVEAVETTDDDGNVTAVEFELPDSSFDGVYVNMYIEASELSLDAYLAVDYESAEAAEEESLRVTAVITVADGVITDISLEVNTEDEDISALLAAAEISLTEQLSGLSPNEALELYEAWGFDDSVYSLEEITEAVLSALSLAAEDYTDSDTDSDDETETESETETETESETVTEDEIETTTINIIIAEKETTTKKSSGSSSAYGSGSHYYVGVSSSKTAEEDDDDDDIEEVSYTSGYEVRVTIGSTSVIINGKTSLMEAAPYIQTESSSTLVPLRFVALAILGGSVSDADESDIVSWDADTRTAKIYAGDDVISFTADSNYVTINGVTSAMSYGVKAEIKDNRMYIPFRALGEALGVEVDWDSSTKTAIYTTD
ncbi:MAG: copper amine oxidase N-terminal domain-containing protein [Clostridiales bacterium]|nr:copper amine oxidase N-terminal domain-containing protein [Clostridiales bacterium]